MDQYLNLLLSMPLFCGVRDKKDLAWFLKCVDGEVKRYRAGETIFSAGEDIYFSTMVVFGTVETGTPESGTLAHVDVGALIPMEFSAEKSVQAPWNVVAKTDCQVLFMRWIRLMKMCNFDCAFHKRILENLEKLTK